MKIVLQSLRSYQDANDNNKSGNIGPASLFGMQPF
jgi:hypothetical protein